MTTEGNWTDPAYPQQPAFASKVNPRSNGAFMMIGQRKSGADTAPQFGRRALVAVAVIATMFGGIPAVLPAHADGAVVSPNAAPGATTRFRIGARSPLVQAKQTIFNFQATDQFGVATPAYNGVGTLTSTDPLAILPGPIHFVNGVANEIPVTFNTTGEQNLTITDTVNPSITSFATVIVNAPGPAVSFTVTITSPPTVTVGQWLTFTVVARDGNGDVAIAYPGTVHFTSTSLGNVPLDTKLNNGKGTFSAKLQTLGRQLLTATDTVSPSVTGSYRFIIN